MWVPPKEEIAELNIRKHCSWKETNKQLCSCPCTMSLHTFPGSIFLHELLQCSKGHKFQSNQSQVPFSKTNIQAKATKYHFKNFVLLCDCKIKTDETLNQTNTTKLDLEKRKHVESLSSPENCSNYLNPNVFLRGPLWSDPLCFILWECRTITSLWPKPNVKFIPWK